jgi:hypothetical protein
VRQSFRSLSEFLIAREELKPNQALTMGIAPYADATVVTQKYLKDISPERRVAEQLIARDRDHMAWPEGAALAMLDLDNPQDIPADIAVSVPSSPNGWRDLLVEIFPALADCPMAWAPSSSSFIFVDDEEIQGLRGQRFYIVLEGGLDIPRFAEALADGCSKRGLVWIKISKSGQRLLRYPFDMAVYQPERLDFAAPPQCEPPVTRRPLDARVWNDDGPYLGASDIPVTTTADRRIIDATVLRKQQAAAPEASRVREAWIQEMGRRIALHRPQLSQEESLAVAQRALEKGALAADFVLTDSEGQSVTVGELLSDPRENHGRRFHDPLEPDYRNDPRIAVLLVDQNGRARIFSHAHGGQSWDCLAGTATIVAGLINETVDQIQDALSHDNAGLYRSGTELVAVDEAQARVVVLDVDGLALRLQRQFEVLASTKSGLKPRDLSPRALRALASETGLLPIPELATVATGPFARIDGSVVDVPGYDPASLVMYVSRSASPPMARRHLTIPEAEKALGDLWHPFSNFSLATPVDRGAVLAAILTCVCRESLPIAPAYLFTAPAASAGKTTLAETIGALQTGRSPSVAALPRDDEEIRKHVLATVRAGSRFLIYDNAERGSELDSTALAHLITGTEIEGRVLGATQIVRLPNRLTLAITGNNVTLRGDLNRRILRITLDSAVENPWARKFPFEPVEYVLNRWVQLRIAALELIATAMEEGGGGTGSTGFEAWDRIVRSTVGWIIENLDIGIDFADPAELIKEQHQEDPEAECLGELLGALCGVYGSEDFTAADVEGIVYELSGFQVGKADRDPALTRLAAARNAITDGGRLRQDATELGRYFGKHRNQVVAGLRLERRGVTKGSTRWGVAVVGERRDDL